MKIKKLLFITAVSILIATVAIEFTASDPPNKQLVSAFDQLYIATNRDVTGEINAADAPTVMGKIAVSVPADWRPTGNFQANFEATGAEVIKYHNGIALNIDGKWMEFAKATYRISYQDNISQIIADIPYTWTHELINSADNYQADVLVGSDTDADPDVGLRIFVEGKKDNIIEILRRTEPDADRVVQGFRYLDNVSVTSTSRSTFNRTTTTRITPDNYVIHSDLDKDVYHANLDDLYSFRISAAVIDNDLPYAGFIKEFSADNITVDPIELITSQDTARIAELGLTEQDLAAGYYIHNPDSTLLTWQLAENTIYTFIDRHNDYTQPDASKKVRTNRDDIFRGYLQSCGAELQLPFLFTIQNSTVTHILENF